MKKLYRNFIFDLTVALAALVLGIVMLPPFGIGVYMLNVMLAAAIVVYFLVYLFSALQLEKFHQKYIFELDVIFYNN